MSVASRLVLAAIAVLAAACAAVGSVIHGVAYGDVLGAPGMSRIASGEMVRSYAWLTLATLLQIVAVLLLVPATRHAPFVTVFSASERPSKLSTTINYAIGFVAVVALTVLTASAMVQLLRHIRR